MDDKMKAAIERYAEQEAEKIAENYPRFGRAAGTTHDHWHEAAKRAITSEREKAQVVVDAAVKLVGHHEFWHSGGLEHKRCPLCYINMSMEDHMHDCPYRLLGEALANYSLPLEHENK